MNLQHSAEYTASGTKAELFAACLCLRRRTQPLCFDFIDITQSDIPRSVVLTRILSVPTPVPAMIGQQLSSSAMNKIAEPHHRYGG